LPSLLTSTATSGWQLDHYNLEYIMVDNALLHLRDLNRAQELADAFERVDKIHTIDRYPVHIDPSSQ
jgi:hypothetical protein